MHVSVRTQEEIETQRVRKVGTVEGRFAYHKNGSSSSKVAEQEGTKALRRKAQEIGGDIIVFEPHVEMPPSNGNGKATLLMSALVYRSSEL